MYIADYGFNPIQDGFFRGCSRMGLGFLAPLPKIRHTYPTTIKVGTVIPYLRKIQKMYESCDTSLEFWTGNQQILLHQEIHIEIRIWWIISNSFNFSWVFSNSFNKLGYNFDDASKNNYSRPS